jgi:integrase
MGVRVKAWKDGWWIFINHHGRRKAKRCASKKAAELAADKIDAALKLGRTEILEPRPCAPPTFAHYAEQWLKAVAATRVREGTVVDYRIRLKRLFPLIGTVPLTAITRDRVRTCVGELAASGNRRTRGRRPLARGTLKNTLSLLHAILERAVEDGLVQRNPAVGLTRDIRSTAATQAPEVEIFTRGELGRLLAAAEREWPAWHPFLFTLARAGLRLGEAVGLEWRDVDFDQRVLIVRRSVNHAKGRASAPKNGKGRRVDMSRQLAATLWAHKSLREAEAVVAGVAVPERVFATPEGEPIRDDAFRRDVWTRILRRENLRYRKPHALRHSFASLLIEAGEPLTYIQQQLGHHSPAFTLGVYGHLLPRGDRRAVDRLDDDVAPEATLRNPPATTDPQDGILDCNSNALDLAVSDLRR